MTPFLSAFGLGLAFFAAPGAITAQLLRRGLERGFLSALSLQLGALIGVTLWAVLAFVGAAFLAQNVFVRLILSVVGILLLLWLAWQALSTAYHGKISEAREPDVRGDFALGVALSLANPLPIAFWLSIGSTCSKAKRSRHMIVSRLFL